MNARLFYLLGILLSLISIFWSKNRDLLDSSVPPEAPSPKIEFQFVPELPKERVSIEINPMIELDFKAKDEVFDIRKKYVAKYPKFVKNTYQPSQYVFGRIVDKAAWWGIEGLYFYGPGKQSIEGPSEESRFIANPLLLVGLCEFNAYPLSAISGRKDLSYPKPFNLFWEPEKLAFTVKYDVKTYFRYFVRYNLPDRDQLDLISYNARDLGFEYLYIFPKTSSNVEFLNPPGKAVRITQFLQLGSSCGYPGGGNNMNFEQNNMRIKIAQLPAKIHIGLWRDQPADISTQPDINVIMDLGGPE
ncbi:MAG: hypothetical protein HQM08_24065 [Candidatus Riflebacteria bacterium]|nr:hypothetical protein [Candidatus Riflebacteria bacterium]